LRRNGQASHPTRINKRGFSSCGARAALEKKSAASLYKTCSCQVVARVLCRPTSESTNGRRPDATRPTLLVNATTGAQDLRRRKPFVEQTVDPTPRSSRSRRTSFVPKLRPPRPLANSRSAVSKPFPLQTLENRISDNTTAPFLPSVDRGCAILGRAAFARPSRPACSWG